MSFLLRPLLARAAAAAALAGCAITVQAQTIKLGHITPPTHVWHQIAMRMAAELEQTPGAVLRISVSPLAKLGNEPQMIQLMQAGAQQLGIITVGALSNREQSLQAWSLPYVFDDVAQASQASATPAARAMLERLQQHGLVGLGYAFAGMRHVLSLQPVRSAQDLAHKKIRSFPSPLYNDWWNAVGAAPTAMTLSEIAPSLTTGLLDAVDVDLDALVGMKLHYQAPYLTLTHHTAFPAMIVASRKWWDALGEADRALLTRVVQDAQQWGVQAAIDADRSNLEQARADGAQVVNADLQAFEAAGAQVREKYLSRNPLIAQFYTQARAAMQPPQSAAR